MGISEDGRRCPPPVRHPRLRRDEHGNHRRRDGCGGAHHLRGVRRQAGDPFPHLRAVAGGGRCAGTGRRALSAAVPGFQGSHRWLPQRSGRRRSPPRTAPGASEPHRAGAGPGPAHPAPRRPQRGHGRDDRRFDRSVRRLTPDRCGRFRPRAADRKRQRRPTSTRRSVPEFAPSARSERLEEILLSAAASVKPPARFFS